MSGWRNSKTPGHKKQKQKQKNEKLKWPVNKHRAVNSKTFDQKTNLRLVIKLLKGIQV
jgi:hypothetical protein